MVAQEIGQFPLVFPCFSSRVPVVEAVLQAQGYTTHLSPEGPDKGIDILAAAGPLGFDRPRICVQVTVWWIR